MGNRVDRFKLTKHKKLMKSLDFNAVNLDTVVSPKSASKKSLTFRKYRDLLKENQWTQKEFSQNGYDKHLIAFINWFLKGKCSLDRETFHDEYVINLIELKDISKKHNIPHHVISFLREYYGIKRQGHKRRLRKLRELPLSDRQRKLILGSLLGDAKLEGQSKNIFAVRHSAKQSDYCEWKLSILSQHSTYDDLRSDSTYDERFDTFSESRFFQTLSHSEIEDIGRISYVGKVKVLTEEYLSLLDDFSLAVWFMDDASSCFRGERRREVKLHTESFTYEENCMISNWLMDKYGIHTTVQKKGLNFVIYFCGDNADKLIKVVSPHVIESMRYKVDGDIPRDFNPDFLTKTPTKSNFLKLEDSRKSVLNYHYLKEVDS